MWSKLNVVEATKTTKGHSQVGNGHPREYVRFSVLLSPPFSSGFIQYPVSIVLIGYNISTHIKHECTHVHKVGKGWECDADARTQPLSLTHYSGKYQVYGPSSDVF